MEMAHLLFLALVEGRGKYGISRTSQEGYVKFYTALSEYPQEFKIILKMFYEIDQQD